MPSVKKYNDKELVIRRRKSALKYYYKNSEKVKACNALWRKKNPEKVRIYANRITAKKKNNSRFILTRTWWNMFHRCYVSTDSKYHRYGGRGITICVDWLTSRKSFIEWALVNGFKKGLHLDRIDNDGAYSPENCRFVNSFVNANNRSTNKFVTYLGVTKTLAEWSRVFSISQGTLSIRYKNGDRDDRLFRPTYSNI
jgi:hypothetical protein